MNYEQLTMNYANKNKANSNPIKPNTKPIKANKMPKQTQNKPNQTQSRNNSRAPMIAIGWGFCWVWMACLWLSTLKCGFLSLWVSGNLAEDGVKVDKKTRFLVLGTDF